MSWSDYTQAKHFGKGIFRPHSDFLADILLEIDNRLANEPDFARALVPFPTRDTIIIIGKQVTIIFISRACHRHYPLFHTYHWSEFLDNNNEKEMIDTLGLSLSEAKQLSLPSLEESLKKELSFMEPLGFSVPSTSHLLQSEIRKRCILSAADLLLSFEHKHYKEMLEMEKPKEIFLSHKSVDKKLVRETAKTLSAIGFHPWLDEDKMKAGANLERSIQQGFTNSCAAVFFVTPNFVDDGFLATEIDYALAEKREKGDRFSIITLLLPGADGEFGTVPSMIRRYVWKEIEPIEVTRTIIEALPIRMDRIIWR